MRVFTLAAVSTLLAAIGLASGCATPGMGEPVATRPSLTIYPVQMADQPREDVAALVATMLEQRGMESIEVDDAVYTADAGVPFDDQASAFAEFVRDRGISTEYAYYGAVIGSPQRGVDEIHGVLVDGSGHVAWSDHQTRESRALKRSNPSDPMSCTVFLVDRLKGPLDLRRPTRAGDAEGKWAQHWRSDALAPTDAERDAMRGRLDRLKGAPAAATVLVYAARTGNSWSAECADRLADEINRKGLLHASVAADRIDFAVEPARNQQKVLWSGARSIQQIVRANPPQADYVLLTDFMVSARSGEAMAVHTFLLDARGDWVIVDFQNSHHDDFNRIRPGSLDDCCDLSVVRLDRHLGS